jgi:hypothetical protein
LHSNLAWMHSMIAYQFLEVEVRKLHKGVILEVWLAELRFVVSTRTTVG